MYSKLMNIDQSKQIPLDGFLSRLGYVPSRRAGNQLWYLSPFRDEDTPSFKVNTGLNAWYDFGEGKGGDLIDFVTRLERLGNISEALARIEQLAGGVASPTRPQRVASASESPPSLQLTSIGPVRSIALRSYLKERGIDLKRVGDRIKEAHYLHGRSGYYALAFANNSGGYELRNISFKGTLGAKDLTTIAGDPTRVQVFEGFFDYLTSLMVGGGSPAPTAIVLNSVALRERAVAEIECLKPTTVELYRDNDPAGAQLLDYFRKTLTNVQLIDRSDTYRQHVDLNDWFMATKTAASCIA